MGQADVRAIVVAYRSNNTLSDCVASVLGSSSARVAVTVVNNEPSDDGPRALAASGSLDLIEMGSNVGFCRAVNAALADVSEPYVLLLNPDARIAADYVARLVEPLAADPTIASAGGRIMLGLDPGTNVIDSLGIEIARGRRPRDIGQGDTAVNTRGTRTERFGVSAAAALYRRTALDEVQVDGQVLPEDFFMYFDDVDLAWRLRLHGYRSLVDTDAVAWHERGAVRGPAPSGLRERTLGFARRARFVRELEWVNLQLMLVRNDDPDLFLAAYVDHVVVRGPRDAFRALQDPGLAVRQRVRAATLLPAALRQRRVIQGRRRVGAREMRPWLA